jgi:signal transduction histidine kinase
MKAEEDRRYLLIELGRKNLELEQLIYITSHDLRSPLVNIEGYGSELNNSLKDVLSALEGEKVPMRIKNKISSIVNEDIAESVKVIHSSIFQMNRLISGILKYSRTGKTELTIEDIDVNKMMADIAENFKFRQKESATEMEISPLLSCRGDADQLNQLFSNLVDNAMKHCDPNRPCVIKIHGHKDRDHSVYCIEDNGVGIAPAHQEKIFKLFYKLDQGNVKGEGLGLTIAGRIVEMHNGKIWVESEPSKGSRFIVSLPAYEN